MTDVDHGAYELLRRVLFSIECVLAVSAFAGSWYGIAGAPSVPTSWLDGTPFDSYLVPSLILGFVVGNVHSVAALALYLRARRATTVVFVSAAVLATWIGVQVALIGYVSWLQPAMLLAALACAVLAEAMRRTTPPHRHVR